MTLEKGMNVFPSETVWGVSGDFGRINDGQYAYRNEKVRRYAHFAASRP